MHDIFATGCKGTFNQYFKPWAIGFDFESIKPLEVIQHWYQILGFSVKIKIPENFNVYRPVLIFSWFVL